MFEDIKKEFDEEIGKLKFLMPKRKEEKPKEEKYPKRDRNIIVQELKPITKNLIILEKHYNKIGSISQESYNEYRMVLKKFKKLSVELLMANMRELDVDSDKPIRELLEV